MGWQDVGASLCPVARALAVVGDRWTVLIVRELFLGTRRFEDFQAQTGMSSHLLSTRLKRLESDGIVRRTPYSERPPRYEYRLTPKGLDLYPLLLSLKAWGEKWSGLPRRGEPALTITHRPCGHPVTLAPVCPECQTPVNAKDAVATLSAGFQAERLARRAGAAAHAEGPRPTGHQRRKPAPLAP
ncbi:helix-turn-helix domain-containing protein [Comamonas sp. SCN 65-56]|uniref:winged helix-turn-helix transcriptional regulator n=1 Tax=Comamonas sp. SCN 65-56 TaxID=1660095 RepID=UPI000A487B94|nr:helix-turn-helix domain-containing protein [Comamonas sp. SCN 65-56]